MTSPRPLVHYINDEWLDGTAAFDSIHPSDTRDITS